MSRESNGDLPEFVGKYDDVDLETGVENVKQCMDREFATKCVDQSSLSYFRDTEE